MLHIVTAGNASKYRDEMNDVFRLRHRVFVEEKGWKLRSGPDGLEIDQFDDENAVHMLYLDNGEVVGYLRLLPTTQPYLLTEVLPQLCEEDAPRSPDTWEWTRYCVAKSHRRPGRKLSPVGTALLTGLVDWGLKARVSSVVIEMEPVWTLVLLQLHFRLRTLGLPRVVGFKDAVAVVASFDRRTLERLRSLRKSSGTPEDGPASGS